MRGQTRPMWDFEDVGDWWTRADPAGHRADRRGADHRRHRLRGRPRRGHHQPRDPYQEGDLPPQDAAGAGDSRPRADRRPAAGADRRHRHGRLRALPRGLCQPRLPPDGRGDRRRGPAALQGHTCRAPTATAPTSRRAPTCSSRGGDGRHRLPEGPRRHPRAVAPGRRALQHPPRPDQRGLHALRARLQPRGALGQDRPARGLARHRGRLRRLSRLHPAPAPRPRHPAHARPDRRRRQPLRGDGRDGGGRPDRRRQPAAPDASADALDLYQRALDGRLG